MARTIERKVCPKCSKKNLCSFFNSQGQLSEKCMTEGCNIRMSINTTLIPKEDSIELTFDYPIKFYRGISPEVCKATGIMLGNIGEVVRYNHNNLDGTLTIKERYPNKVFKWVDKTSETSMFNLSNCNDFTKPIYITEGNEDAASLVQLDFQATSVHSAGAHLEGLENGKEKLELFPEIIMCIENDKPGKKVKADIKNMFGHKLVREVDLSPYKDANDFLQKNESELLKEKCLNAVELVPEGIIFGDQLDRTQFRVKPTPAYETSYRGLNLSFGGGYHRGCLYGLFAGTTTGKSTFLREECYYLRTKYPDAKIACLFFEESQRITPQLFLALDKNIPLGKLKCDPELISEKDFNEAWDRLIANDKLMFVDKNFKKDAYSLLQYIEYLGKVKKYDIFIIDHISYIIGRTSSSRQGERKDIDYLIYALQDLTTELNCVTIFASHVVDKANKEDSWESGKVPNIYSGRGSGVLAQAPDGIIMLSRDNRYNILNIHCGKSRWDGEIGLTDTAKYVKETGRLIKR